MERTLRSAYFIVLLKLVCGCGVLWLTIEIFLSATNRNTSRESVLGFKFPAFYSSGDHFSVEEIVSGPISQEDPRLIKYIRDNYLVKPTGKPLNISITADPSEGQSDVARKFFNNMKNGFFIEVGANDGVFQSNTVWLEKELNWTGILIEGDPLNYARLWPRNRNAIHVPAGLSLKPYPMKTIFYQYDWGSKITSEDIKSQAKGAVVQCFPLTSILLATGRTQIDFLSLDVEGHELEVLKTIPFDKINITIMTVEVINIAEGKDKPLKFMESKNFVLYEDLVKSRGGRDYVFIQKQYAKKP